MNARDLDTPALIVDADRLEANIADMAAFAALHQIKLRPHAKAHKIPRIALRQLAAGARGITVAKLGEAEVMAKAGIKDILLAYPVVGQQKLERLINLARQVRLSTTVDNLAQAARLGQAFHAAGMKIEVLVEIDTGLKRCGLDPDTDVGEFIEALRKLPGLYCTGLLTHAGHVYAAGNWEEAQAIGRCEGEVMARLAKKLEKQEIAITEVSVGSTPTAKIAGAVPGVTEIRPGNYVFYDAMQVGLGVVEPEQCALTVLTTVVSCPAPDRKVIDAGSKTLALDRGAHGNNLVQGYGLILDYPAWRLTRLSEEHGVLEAKGVAGGPRLGQKLRLLPNHACPVMNLAHKVYVERAGKIVNVWEIAARGQVM